MGRATEEEEEEDCDDGGDTFVGEICADTSFELVVELVVEWIEGEEGGD